jgi:hypothetical protein
MEFVDNEFAESQERPNFPPFGFFIKKMIQILKYRKKNLKKKLKQF